MENNFAIETMATLIYWKGNLHFGAKKTFENEGSNVVYM